jgi:hypothetical protein
MFVKLQNFMTILSAILELFHVYRHTQTDRAILLGALKGYDGA